MAWGQKTWSLITLTFDMIGKLIGGIVSLDNLSGPISIAKGPAAAPITGWSISSRVPGAHQRQPGDHQPVPLPVLDGGHLVYFLIEAITGKPVSEKFRKLGSG